MVKLIQMFDHARQVASEYDGQQDAIRAGHVDSPLKGGLTGKDDNFSHIIDIHGSDDCVSDELNKVCETDDAPTATTGGCHAPGAERDVEVTKRPDEGRIGLLLEKRGRGIVACKVAPGSPAEAAELEPGDTLIAVNGCRVSSATKASQLIASSKEVVRLTMLGVPGACSLHLTKSQAGTTFDFSMGWDGKTKQLRVCALSDSVESRAEPTSLEVGDVVLAIGGTQIDSSPSAAKQAAELLRAAPAGRVTLRIVKPERAILERLGLLEPAYAGVAASA